MRTIPVLWFFFIPFCFINLSTNIFFVNGQYCVGHQESSLLHFKNSLLFNPTKSKKLVHWNQSYDCCQWNGITCSKGRVIALDLSGEFISGRINASSSLFDLQSLQNLNLAYNDFEGQIPESFASLTNLTTLKISSCNLSGEFPGQIFQISNLEVLDLSDNPNLHGSLPNFPRHGSLEVLNISHTSFSGELPYSIHNLRKLSTLDLSNCRFNGTLPSQISELTELVHLDFSFNNFTGLENLTYIDLAGNSLNGRIPSSLFTLPSLQKLMLSYNRFQGVLDEFPNASSSMLEFLDINGNNLEGPIPESVFHLERLRLLNLGLNYFNGSIKLDVISRMGNLVALDLSYNNLSIDTTLRDDNYDLSSSSFPKLKNLRFLDLNGNFLQGSIPKSLGNCQKLQVLNLGNNQLTDRFPCFLRNISTLRVLILRSNNFHGTLECPNNNGIGNWETLQIVDLASNNFSGSLPVMLLQSWKALMLDENDEASPLKFGNLVFDLSDNLNISVVDFKSVFSLINTNVTLKVAQLLRGISPFLIDHMLFDGYFEKYSFRSYQGVQEVSRSDSGSSIDWNFLSAELGFTFGVGIVILPLLFWTKWRMQYFKCVDNMLYKIVPWLDFIHENRGGKIYRSLRWKPY
ncbi:receptor-like protein 12 [Senna tora]|uniref:Receptor-like protein 12 n=1 Tax=Senna tora TaxID=362788 RepID=A0A834XHE7_9FABA|nr:receptor-like protein 12 [Senna tora]